jgi:hypothetical protein
MPIFLDINEIWIFKIIFVTSPIQNITKFRSDTNQLIHAD